MDRAQAVARLPDAYAVALRLHDEGADDAAIAAELEISRAAVPALLAIGERKLAQLLRDQVTGSPASSATRSRRPDAPSLE